MCPRAAPSPLADPVRNAISDGYRAAGQCPPCEDPALSSAATKIAAGPWPALPDPLTRQRLVQEAGAGDPAPRALMAEATDAEALKAAILKALAPEATDNALGVGVTTRGEGLRGVILRSQRRVIVEGLRAQVERGATVTVAGRFLATLTDPTVYVEAPDGSVSQIAVVRSDLGFRGRFTPSSDGRYLVEVMARGARGPEVEYLHPVQVGPAERQAPAEAAPAGADDQAAVIDAINAERQRYSAAALSPDARLTKVAQSYAEEMRAGGFFGHVSPRTGDLVSRLTHAGYRYRRAGENLAQGPSALEAHALAANSPAHRKTMLDPRYNRCGIGISRVIFGDGRPDTLLVEVFALDQP